MGKILFIILAIFLLLGAFSTPIMDGIKGWRTEDTTESHSVVTILGQTTANVTLASDLFQDDIAEVITVTSNISGESPIATSYVSASKKLLVSALNPAATHTLTINYYADTESGVIYVLGPFLPLIIIGGLLVIILQSGLKKRR